MQNANTNEINFPRARTFPLIPLPRKTPESFDVFGEID